MPHKRKVAIALSAMGSTGLGVLRWLTGQWIPSWAQLSQNPIFQGYVVASALLGAALTFWFDDRKNPKLNTLINVRGGLVNVTSQMTEMVSTCFSTPSRWLSGLLVWALCTTALG